MTVTIEHPPTAPGGAHVEQRNNVHSIRKYTAHTWNGDHERIVLTWPEFEVDFPTTDLIITITQEH